MLAIPTTPMHTISFPYEKRECKDMKVGNSKQNKSDTSVTKTKIKPLYNREFS